MKRLSVLPVLVFFLGLVLQSCNNGKTYAELKEEEKEAIQRFIDKQDINVISFNQFAEQDSVTNADKNEYVLFSESGVYMQILDKGNGETMEDGRHEILIRYMEAQINESGELDTLTYNTGTPYPDVMQLTKSGKSYSATFTEGAMYSYYSVAYVPTGWLIPFDYLKVGREIPARSKIRLIVPHSEGTQSAAGSVYPCYYEITYQLAR
ncbi:MAG: DUF4827 domain-containing protein [Bacteroidales bacterium]|nr:DUF4827 domain-containing protein [Bacteroidales bacterium]